MHCCASLPAGRLRPRRRFANPIVRRDADRARTRRLLCRSAPWRRRAFRRGFHAGDRRFESGSGYSWIAFGGRGSGDFIRSSVPWRLMEALWKPSTARTFNRSLVDPAVSYCATSLSASCVSVLIRSPAGGESRRRANLISIPPPGLPAPARTDCDGAAVGGPTRRPTPARRSASASMACTSAAARWRRSRPRRARPPTSERRAPAGVDPEPAAGPARTDPYRDP